jgi:hypothetical protein
MPTCRVIVASSEARSFEASQRPDAPPCPAGSISTLSSSALALVVSGRSLATYLAGSRYVTWLS